MRPALVAAPQGVEPALPVGRPRRRCVRGVEDRGAQVDQADRVVAGLALTHPGPGHEDRDPERRLVGARLAGPEPMLAQEVPVVRREHEDGAFPLTGGLQLTDQAADLTVHGEDRLRALSGQLGHGGAITVVQLRQPPHVGALVTHAGLGGTPATRNSAGPPHVVETPLDPRGSSRGAELGVVALTRAAVVRRDEVDVHEERLPGTPPAGREASRHALREVADDDGLVGATVAVVQPPVDVVRRVEVVVDPAVDLGETGIRERGAPVGPPTRNVLPRRLAADQRAVVAVLVEVLADESGVVADRVERGREGPGIVEGAVGIGLLVPVDLMVVRIGTGQERGARRAAQGKRRE